MNRSSSKQHALYSELLGDIFLLGLFTTFVLPFVG
jgi:hypothetical protein